GTPTAAGTSSVTLSAANTGGTGTATLNLTINAVVSAPVVTQQPQNQSVTAGQTAAFSVTATGTAPLSYQWQSKPSGAPSFSNISSATGSSYTTPATSLSDSGAQFQCVVSNSAGTVTSSAAALTVTTTPVAPTISQQPQNASVNAGQNATFSITANGTSPLGYQWQYALPGTSFFYNFPGATATSYATSPTSLSDSGTQWRCVVTNSVGSATSNAATLTVTSSGGTTLPAPTLNLPSYLSVNGTISLSYPAGYSGITFQWTITPANASPYGAPCSGLQAPGNTAAVSKLQATSLPIALSLEPRAAGAPSAIFRTASPSVSLSSYGLAPGYYTLAVQAFDSAGNSSPQAQANVTLVSADLSGVRVFPNPWRSDKHANKPITFDTLPLGSTVKIFTVSGHHVRTLSPQSSGLSPDKVTWDLTNDSGDKVAS